MLIIPALGRLKREDYEFKASLGTQQGLVSKTKENIKKQIKHKQKRNNIGR
jgi:hypothetical protein